MSWAGISPTIETVVSPFGVQKHRDVTHDSRGASPHTLGWTVVTRMATLGTIFDRGVVRQYQSGSATRNPDEGFCPYEYYIQNMTIIQPTIR